MAMSSETTSIDEEPYQPASSAQHSHGSSTSSVPSYRRALAEGEVGSTMDAVVAQGAAGSRGSSPADAPHGAAVSRDKKNAAERGETDATTSEEPHIPRGSSDVSGASFASTVPSYRRHLVRDEVRTTVEDASALHLSALGVDAGAAGSAAVLDSSSAARSQAPMVDGGAGHPVSDEIDAEKDTHVTQGVAFFGSSSLLSPVVSEGSPSKADGTVPPAVNAAVTASNSSWLSFDTSANSPKYEVKCVCNDTVVVRIEETAALAEPNLLAADETSNLEEAELLDASDPSFTLASERQAEPSPTTNRGDASEIGAPHVSSDSPAQRLQASADNATASVQDSKEVLDAPTIVVDTDSHIKPQKEETPSASSQGAYLGVHGAVARGDGSMFALSGVAELTSMNASSVFESVRERDVDRLIKETQDMTDSQLSVLTIDGSVKVPMGGADAAAGRASPRKPAVSMAPNVEDFSETVGRRSSMMLLSASVSPALSARAHLPETSPLASETEDVLREKIGSLVSDLATRLSPTRAAAGQRINSQMQLNDTSGGVPTLTRSAQGTFGSSHLTATTMSSNTSKRRISLHGGVRAMGTSQAGSGDGVVDYRKMRDGLIAMSTEARNEDFATIVTKREVRLSLVLDERLALQKKLRRVNDDVSKLAALKSDLQALRHNYHIDITRVKSEIGRVNKQMHSMKWEETRLHKEITDLTSTLQHYRHRRSTEELKLLQELNAVSFELKNLEASIAQEQQAYTTEFRRLKDELRAMQEEIVSFNPSEWLASQVATGMDKKLKDHAFDGDGMKARQFMSPALAVANRRKTVATIEEKHSALDIFLGAGE